MGCVNSDSERRERNHHKPNSVCFRTARCNHSDVLTTTIDMIDLKTQEIKLADDETYSDMQSVADELPDSSPRFILLSYPITMVRDTKTSLALDSICP